MLPLPAGLQSHWEEVISVRLFRSVEVRKLMTNSGFDLGHFVG